jgi:hypothetical protein
MPEGYGFGLKRVYMESAVYSDHVSGCKRKVTL